jgi:UDP-N-acetylmuramoylalanine--D-glutamate ligase
MRHDDRTSAGSADEQLRGKGYLNLANKKVLVVGLAKTGLAVTRFLKEQGAQVTATDALSKEKLGSYADQALSLGVSLELGGHKTESFVGADLVVVSPGVPERISPLKAAAQSGVPIIGEIELASRFIGEPIAAITGTNGKTTTTSLVGEMLKASGRKVYVGGNIGAPLIDYVSAGVDADVVVAEVSSFQLDTIDQFRPNVGALLNITEDHLDRYNHFNDYVRSKGQLFRNQLKTDAAILNGMDPVVRRLEPFITSQKLYFRVGEGRRELEPEAVHGAVVEDRELICILPSKGKTVFDLSGLKLKGKHNLENVGAAALTALFAGGSRAGIQAALDRFEGLPHRLELVGTINDVDYYNDSKATNVDAVRGALESFDRPVILLMGGRNKGGGYSSLEKLIKGRVKRLVVFGEARETILSALGHLKPSEKRKDLVAAVNLAHQQAASGDVVLLAPGCSSFDMYANYAERGQAFCTAVEKLSEGS